MFKTLAIGALALCVLCSSVASATELSIIPKPQKLEVDSGSYRLDAHTRIVAPADARGREIAAFLSEAIRQQTGVTLGQGQSAHDIVLTLDPAVQGDEAYRLSVTAQRIAITAATDKGLFWGVQTLRQLLPLEKARQWRSPRCTLRMRRPSPIAV